MGTVSPCGPLPAPLRRHELQLERPEALGLRRELAGRRVRLDFLAAYGADFIVYVDVERGVQAVGAEEVAWQDKRKKSAI